MDVYGNSLLFKIQQLNHIHNKPLKVFKTSIY